MGRNFLGTPPKGRAGYAFFQHILKSLDETTGRCAILFPHGVLFRKEETGMRQKLVEADLVECVLGLGPNLKPEHQERIAAAYHAFMDITGFAHVATLDEICASDGNLSIPLYVRRRGVREDKGIYAADGLKAAVRAWEESSGRLNEKIDALLRMLEN